MIRFGVAVATLWLGAVLQLAWSPYLAVFGVQPNWILISVACVSLCVTRGQAVFAGFFGGVLQGALAGANMAHYVVSRTLAAFCAAWSRRLRIEMTSPAVALTVAATTVLAQLVLMFTAAPRGIVGFLGDTIGTAVYNGVLAMPVYALLKRILIPPVR